MTNPERRRFTYFIGMSLVLATIVAGGFVRTFYLRPAFLATLTNPEPLPARVTCR